MIPVTKTFFPPLEEYQKQLIPIWEKKWLTNRGETVKKMENEIKQHLECVDFIAMNNGTIPLQIALKILGKGGEIITTPFSYVATTSAIVWENCTPVFDSEIAKNFTPFLSQSQSLPIALFGSAIFKSGILRITCERKVLLLGPG